MTAMLKDINQGKSAVGVIHLCSFISSDIQDFFTLILDHEFSYPDLNLQIKLNTINQMELVTLF